MAITLEPCELPRMGERKQSNDSILFSLDIFPYRNICTSCQEPRQRPTSSTRSPSLGARDSRRSVRRQGMLSGMWFGAADAAAGGVETSSRASQGGVVSVTKQGQLRLYRLNAKELKPVHDWVKMYERFWTHQIDQIKERAERKMMDRIARESQTK